MTTPKSTSSISKPAMRRISSVNATGKRKRNTDSGNLTAGSSSNAPVAPAAKRRVRVAATNPTDVVSDSRDVSGIEEENQDLEEEEEKESEGETEDEGEMGGNAQGQEKPIAYKRTTKEHYEAMVDWLEKPGNFDLVTGNAAKGKPVDGKKLKPKTGFELLMGYVNKHVNIPNHLQLWTGKSAKGRFSTFKDKYKAEERASRNATGYGLEPKHIKAGLKTIDERKEYECPCFARMDALFGKKHNVNPILVREFGGVSASTLVPETSTVPGTPAFEQEDNEPERSYRLQPEDLDQILQDMDDFANRTPSPVSSLTRRQSRALSTSAPALAPSRESSLPVSEEEDDDEPPKRTKKRDFAATYAETEREHLKLKRRLQLENEKLSMERAHLQARLDFDWDKLKLNTKANFVRDLALGGIHKDKIRDLLDEFFQNEL